MTLTLQRAFLDKKNHVMLLIVVFLQYIVHHDVLQYFDNLQCDIQILNSINIHMNSLKTTMRCTGKYLLIF